MIVAYESNGTVYYDYGNRTRIYVASNAKFISVSGNFIVYEQRGTIYKAEVNSNGTICRSGIYVGKA